MSFRSVFAAVVVTAAFYVPAVAHDATVGTLSLTDLWTRATPPNARTGGGYLVITNSGDAPDRLIAVSSPQVDNGEIHQMSVADGVMTMRPLEDGLEIPAHGSVTLAPGGFHLMFMGLKAPFVDGEKVPVTFTFANAGSLDTFLHIQSIGAKGPESQGDHEDMKMEMTQ